MGKLSKNKKDLQTNLQVGFVLLQGKKCRYCQFHATSQNLLDQHVNGIHNLIIKSSLTKIQKDKSLRSEMKKGILIQNTKISRQCQLTRALKKGVITLKGLKCSICNFMATSQKLLKNHTAVDCEKSCLIKRTVKVIITGHNCSICQYWTTSSKLLDDHSALHCYNKP